MNELQLRALARLTTIRTDEEGQTFAEYGLILALIIVAVAAVFSAFDTALTGAFNDIISAIGGG